LRRQPFGLFGGGIFGRFGRATAPRLDQGVQIKFMAAFGAFHWVFVEVVKAGTATGAGAFGSKIWFGHGAAIPFGKMTLDEYRFVPNRTDAKHHIPTRHEGAQLP
jgi:hypothetical protein